MDLWPVSWPKVTRSASHHSKLQKSERPTIKMEERRRKVDGYVGVAVFRTIGKCLKDNDQFNE